MFGGSPRLLLRGELKSVLLILKLLNVAWSATQWHSPKYCKDVGHLFLYLMLTAYVALVLVTFLLVLGLNWV